MGVDAGDLQDAVLIHPPDGVQVLRQESDAVHTRVHCDMYLEAHAVLPAVGLQLGGVVRAGGGLGQPVLCQQAEIRRGAVSQDQDLPLDAGLPQLDRLVQRGSGKVADAQLPQLGGHRPRPVSVSVRLHHAHDPAARWQKVLVAPDVVGQGLPVQFNPSPIHLSPCRRSAAALPSQNS